MRPLLAVLLLLLAVAPAAEARRPPCSKGGTTVAATDVLRVFERGSKLRACVRSTRARTVLAREFDDGYVTSGHYAFVSAAGPYVAWAESYTDVSCKASCPPDYAPTRVWVTVRHVPARTQRSADAFLPTDVAVTRAGAVAWIDSGAVHALDAAGERELDRGMVSGLEASATRVSWLNEGTLRVAALGAAG